MHHTAPILAIGIPLLLGAAGVTAPKPHEPLCVDKIGHPGGDS